MLSKILAAEDGAASVSPVRSFKKKKAHASSLALPLVQAAPITTSAYLGGETLLVSGTVFCFRGGRMEEVARSLQNTHQYSEFPFHLWQPSQQHCQGKQTGCREPGRAEMQDS